MWPAQSSARLSAQPALPASPPDLNSYAKFPALTRALLENGYSAEDIKKIYGGNMLRVMRAVEQRARELKGMAALETSVDKK